MSRTLFLPLPPGSPQKLSHAPSCYTRTLFLTIHLVCTCFVSSSPLSMQLTVCRSIYRAWRYGAVWVQIGRPFEESEVSPAMTSHTSLSQQPLPKPSVPGFSHSSPPIATTTSMSTTHTSDASANILHPTQSSLSRSPYV